MSPEKSQRARRTQDVPGSRITRINRPLYQLDPSDRHRHTTTGSVSLEARTCALSSRTCRPSQDGYKTRASIDKCPVATISIDQQSEFRDIDVRSISAKRTACRRSSVVYVSLRKGGSQGVAAPKSLQSRREATRFAQTNGTAGRVEDARANLSPQVF